MDGILFCGIILFFFYNFVLYLLPTLCAISVVVATAKVRIFKQITTSSANFIFRAKLLLLPQRYEFSSKSQLSGKVFSNDKLLLLPQRYEFSSKSQPLGLSVTRSLRCCCYRKGTNFQANHNNTALASVRKQVVVATAKVRIFKQITTN